MGLKPPCPSGDATRRSHPVAPGSVDLNPRLCVGLSLRDTWAGYERLNPVLPLFGVSFGMENRQDHDPFVVFHKKLAGSSSAPNTFAHHTPLRPLIRIQRVGFETPVQF